MSTAFLEDYILSDNRLQATFDAFDDDQEEYWFYTLLNLQTKFANSDDPELDVWIKKVRDTPFKESKSVKKLLLRQAVKDFNSVNLENCRAELRAVIDVNVDYRKDEDADGIAESGDQREFESTLMLNIKKIISDKFAAGNILEDFTPAAAETLAKKKIENEQIGDLLQLITDEAPDLHYLLTNIKKDMAYTGKGFGSRAIHYKLTKKMLDTLLDKDKSLLDDLNFLETYAKKMRPVSDTNLADDPVAKSAYIAALFQFGVKCKTQTNFMGTIMYNYMLDCERSGEGYNRKVMKAYVKIPKSSSTWMPAAGAGGLEFDYTIPGVPEIEAIGDDEPLVRRALTRFFIEGDKATPWSKETALDASYALPLWSEVMLLEGTGNDKFQLVQQESVDKGRKGYFANTLVPRVDLELAPTNRRFYTVEEPVNISLLVKNNPSITVNVYEVCAKNYYVQNRQEVPSDLNLSGSMPIASFVNSYEDEPPLLKKPREIAIPQLGGKRGVFIVDMIGNGVGCRACIRKGQMRFVSKQTPDGYVFKVVDEANREIKTGRVWCGGVDYDANAETGEILVPFGGEENEQELIVVEDSTQPSSSTLSTFYRKTKTFRLETGFYIDREAILERREAQIIIRPNLYLNEDAVSLSNIQDPTITVTTTDNTGLKNTRVEEVELFDTKETLQEVLVPVNLRSIEVVLNGSIASEGGASIPVMNSQTFKCNLIDDDSFIADMFLYPAGAAGYVISVQGKNGEPFKDRIIDLTMYHRFFTEPLTKTVQSDHNGLVYLGRLVDIDRITAKPRDSLVFSSQTWNLLVDKVNVPPVVCARVGDTVKIPFISIKKQGPSVLIYDKDYIESFSKNYSYKRGFIDIKGLPAGDFTVFIRDTMNANVTVHIADGPIIENRMGKYVVGKSRIVELSEEVPLQVTSVKGSRSRGYAIRVEGINETTRLHVLMTAYIPRYTAFALLAAPNRHPEVVDFRQVMSEYSPSAAIASEFAYVMNRKKSGNQLGNLLTRPSLLAGRWAPGPDPARDEAAPAPPPEEFKDSKLVQKYKKELFRVAGADMVNLVDSSNMEFLGQPSKVYANLKPDAEGTVTIPSTWISEQNRMIQIVALDDDNTCVRNVILEESQAETQLTDTRLNPGLDYMKHFTEARNVVCLPLEGDKYLIEDLLTAEYEPFETLDEIFYLYRAVKAGESADAKAQIARFEPLVGWDTLSEEQRLAFYDDNMSNEVNYFLYKKDQDFFNTVVVPTVRNKLVKTFFDKWLLKENVSDYATNLAKLMSLNCFEKILLAERMQTTSFTDATLRSIREAAALVPKRPQEEDRRFALALQSRQLSQDLLEAEPVAAPAPAAEAAASPAEAGEVVADVEITGIEGMGLGIEQKDEGPAPAAAGAAIDTTKTFQERWYTDVPLAETTSDLITPTAFWASYASFVLEKGSAGAFLDPQVTMATKNVSEMLLSLACTDLPLTADEPITTPMSADDKNERPLQITAKDPVILFVKEIVSSEMRTSAISVSVNYFDPARKTEIVDGEEVDLFVKANQFQAAKVYGCRAVVTNVSSVPQSCELLIQIPQGAVPVNGGFRTKNFREVVPAFETAIKTYYFYFPAEGTYNVFPVHVNKNGATIGFSREDKILTVGTGGVSLEKNSWGYIAQNATSNEILDFLTKDPNVVALDMTPMLWRLADPKFFDSCTKVLKERQIYNDQVWAYSLTSDIGGVELGEFLSQNAQFRELAGPAFSSDLCAFDGTNERTFQYLDFTPITNPRMERTTDMTSQDFLAQYKAFLNRVAFSSIALRNVATRDLIAMCVYLLMQNRVGKAREVFGRIAEAKGKELCAETYDYLSAYLSVFGGDFDAAIALADAYMKEPGTPQAKAKWQAIKDQAAEVANPDLADKVFNEERYAAAEEAKKPMIKFDCSLAGQILVDYRNEKSFTIEYWRMDLEVLFSAQPFAQSADSYKWVEPNERERNITLPEGQNQLMINMPSSMRNQNSIIRVTSGSGIVVVDQDYDNMMVCQVARSIGELRVMDTKGGAVSSAYVKVYSRATDGTVGFYKDGYTDLRGRFNYRDVSTSQQANSERFAVMVQTPTLGSSKLEIAA